MRRVLALGAAVAFVAISGCGGNGGPAPEDVVRESADATQEVRSFHFRFDSEGIPPSTTGLQLLGAEGDALVPDRVRAEVSGTFAGVPLTTELVAISADVWIKDPLEGRWRAIDVGTTPSFLLDPVEGVLGVMRRVSDLRDEGREEIAGVEALKLRGTVAVEDVAPLFAVAPGNGRVEATLWIGADDRILRRVEVRGPVASGEGEEALRAVEISRLDEPVTIEAPEASS
ncbi:MAG: LppX_LprAFG lipoprotein [Thermoleophilia bacterium]|nr:LppX_LprAFG lipoprotein [Gaiellaceae bacterium]MDW8339776.1 LppX_LprAFG lipoprotein [Thermoleophilia bacterium]